MAKLPMLLSALPVSRARLRWRSRERGDSSSNCLQIRFFILHTLNADAMAYPVISGILCHAKGTFLSRYVGPASGRVGIRLGACSDKQACRCHDEGRSPSPSPDHSSTLPITASGAGAGQGEFDAPILGPPLRRVVRGNRVRVAEPARRNQVRFDPLRDEEIGDGLRPLQRQLLVAFNPSCAQFGAD